jgi:hypothetical protein
MIQMVETSNNYQSGPARASSKLLALVCFSFLSLAILISGLSYSQQINAQEEVSEAEFNISPATIETVLRTQEDLQVDTEITNPFSGTLVFEIKTTREIVENMQQQSLTIEYSVDKENWFPLDSTRKLIEIKPDGITELSFRLSPGSDRDFNLLIPVTLELDESNEFSLTQRQYLIRLNITSEIQSQQESRQTQLYLAIGAVSVSLIIIGGIGISSFLEARSES